MVYEIIEEIKNKSDFKLYYNVYYYLTDELIKYFHDNGYRCSSTDKENEKTKFCWVSNYNYIIVNRYGNIYKESIRGFDEGKIIYPIEVNI